MIRKKYEGIEWLEFELLQEFSNLSHGSFLRHGGVSQGAFASLNLTGSCGDDSKSVKENRRRLLSLFPGTSLVMGSQVHGGVVSDVGKKAPPLEGCDGLFTEKTNQALMIQHADCQAAIFYDPIHKRLANIHSGWRGSVQNIYKNTIELFKVKGSNPANILVCISPSLGPNFAEFVHFKKELPSFFHEFKGEKDLFNFWQASREQLKQLGVLASHIQVAEICTYENKEDYFSYRRDTVTGRNATIAVLL